MTTLKKSFGSVLIISGVAIILFGLFRSYLIFSGKNLPPEIFQYTPSLETTELEKNVLNKQKASTLKIPQTPKEMQDYIDQAISKNLQALIPADTIPKILNLVAWSIFMGILFFGAGKIASIGAQLLK